MAREYVYEKSMTLSTNSTNTIFQLAAGTAMPLTIIRVIVTQSASTTSTQNSVKIVRKSAAATMTTAAVAADIRKLDPGDAATSVQLGTTLTGYASTATDGTDGDVMHEEGFNILNGFYFEPQPEARITVAGGGIIGIKLGTASALTVQLTIVFFEGTV